MRKLLLLISLVVAVPAAAQTVGDLAAYDALVLTPVGALPPIMTSTISADIQRTALLAFRYGYLTGEHGASPVNSFGVSGVFPFGLGSTFTLTGGVNSPDCRACDPGLMLSVGGDTRLTVVPFGPTRDAARLTISLDGELGFGQFKNVSSLVSGAVGVPIGLVSGGRRAEMRIVPFITPAFGFGNENFNGDAGSESGARFILGGGVGIYNPASTVALNLGFQHVVIDNGGTQIGLSLTLGGR